MRSASDAARRWPGALGVALTVLFAAGCATMPDSGDPEAVVPPQGAGADQGIQVRVVPMPPRDGQNPAEVLQNFLDASIADEANYRTAKQYLTGEALNSWQPDSGTTVVASIAQQKSAGSDPDPTATGQVVLTINSHQIGGLDARHTYRAAPADQQFTGTFTLVNVAKDAKDTKDPKEAAARAEWRISDLPGGLLLDQVSFRNAYQQVDRYFYTQPDPQATGPDQPVLVPDPVYLHRRVDPVPAAARALVAGPSLWLEPAVRSAFQGLPAEPTVTTDDARNPKLQADSVDCVINESLCRQMAAQLFFTLTGLNGSSLQSVQVNGKRGSYALPAATARSLPEAPGSLAGGSPAYVRVSGTGQLARLPISDSPADSVPVAGVLGQPKPPAQLQPTVGRPAGPYAVRRDGKDAAVVSEDGKSLYVAALDDSAKALGQPVVTSRQDQGLTSPSWDGFGDLFVVDRDPSSPRVLMVRDQARAVPVPISGLTDGQAVDSLRVSSDGTRAALLLTGAGGTHSLAIGLVQRGGTAQQPTATIAQVRPVSPAKLADVASVSWADPDTLLVLGKEADSVMQLHYLSTDGSSGIDGSGMQAVDGMRVVAASESRSDPVLADANDGDHTVYRLLGTAQSQWKVVTKNGEQPAYPG
ncbi:LpqB family beta-propeller domain-containing protein [Kitasatospora sp. NPDC006697]|uniref:LpqB family beta-propeller domain-containing protein n=1 Tax=Kitasatospora sp. NPDC006697 TaxID=3364020 RepID=UPI00369605BE